MVSSKRNKRHTYFWSNSTQLLLYFGVVLVIVTMLFTIYYVHQQGNSQSNSHAAASTTLSFDQTNLQVNPGGTFSLNVMMNPGTNAVPLVNLVIGYDSSIVMPNPTTGFQPNMTAFSTVLDGPIYNTCTGNQCTMYISLSVGNDPTKAITQPMTIATVNFNAVGQGTTQIVFDPKTQVYSVAAADKADENVLATTTPAMVVIGQATMTTPILTQTPVGCIGLCPTLTPPTTLIPTLPLSVTPMVTITSNQNITNFLQQFFQFLFNFLRSLFQGFGMGLGRGRGFHFF